MNFKFFTRKSERDKMVMFIMFLWCCSSFLIDSVSASSYLSNGDFETGATSPWNEYWAAQPLVVSPASARSGKYGVLSAGRTASWMGPAQVNLLLFLFMYFCLFFVFCEKKNP